MTIRTETRGAVAPAAQGGAAGVAALCIVMVFWSGTAIAVRFATASVDPLSVGIFRSMIAGFVALAVALVWRMRFPATPRGRLLLLYAGSANFAVWPALMSLGIGYANASHAALIMALLPIATTLIGGFVERRPLNALWWAGAAIAFFGTVLLVLFARPEAEITLSGSFIIGDLIILGGVCVCASGYVAGARLSRSIGSWGSTFWGLSAALLLLVPAMLLLHNRTDWDSVPLSGWAAIGWLVFFSSLAGYALWFFAMARGGIAKTAIWQFVQPVLTLSAAALLLDEPIGLRVVFASVLVIGGTVIAHRHAPSVG